MPTCRFNVTSWISHYPHISSLNVIFHPLFQKSIHSELGKPEKLSNCLLWKTNPVPVCQRKYIRKRALVIKFPNVARVFIPRVVNEKTRNFGSLKKTLIPTFTQLFAAKKRSPCNNRFPWKIVNSIYVTKMLFQRYTLCNEKAR